jgi:hypothetical protein
MSLWKHIWLVELAFVMVVLFLPMKVYQRVCYDGPIFEAEKILWKEL